VKIVDDNSKTLPRPDGFFSDHRDRPMPLWRSELYSLSSLDEFNKSSTP
jgi:hypothetical protein